LKIISKILISPFVLIVKLYQWFVSPILPNSCRFQPTCSHYMVDSLREWGVFKGLFLGVKRILKCHPWGKYGYDPVPENLEKKTKNKKTN
jgi:uncharacterized protein